MDPSIERRLSKTDDQYHRLTAVANDGSTTVSFQVGIHPMTFSASFLAVVSELAEAPIVIAETEISAPASSWELRGEGLWADHICESPFEHWSYGLEAFALQIDDPEELLGRGYGDRVPLGWELEFESEVQPHFTQVIGSQFGYSQTGCCHGVLLFKNRKVVFEGQALRQHWASESTQEQISLATVTSGQRRNSRIALPVVDGTWWLVAKSESMTWEYQPD